MHNFWESTLHEHESTLENFVGFAGGNPVNIEQNHKGIFPLVKSMPWGTEAVSKVNGGRGTEKQA